MTNTKKKTQKQLVDQNPIEAIRDFGTVSARSFLDQILGSEDTKESRKKEGMLSEGEELDLKNLEEQKAKQEFRDIDPGIDYRREILNTGRKMVAEESREMENQIQQILAEIKKLVAESSELQIQYGKVLVEQVPQKAGKYELHFFDWLLITIRQARLRVEDSANWLKMFSSRKKQKQYWNQFKKQGTTFGLSNERVVATQAG